MELKEKLKEIGLSEGESAVYLALLKIGAASANSIKVETKQHRTSVYDFLEKLLNKGLVNYIVQNNKKIYKASHPNKLSDFIQEKERHVDQLVPELLALFKNHKESISVETYQGIEGVKTLLKDVIREGKDYVIFGIDETMFQEQLGNFMEWFFREEKKKGFTERILTSDDVKYVYENDTTTYRYLPKESFNPTPTYVWGENVGILIWEPFTVIRIRSAALADSYLKYFEMLWKQAKKEPAKPIF